MKQKRLPAAKGREGLVTWVVDSVPPGDYAIAVYHDANENGKLDRHLLGYPLEPYGFSNNARGKLGPPAWDRVFFQVGDATSAMEIQLK